MVAILILGNNPRIWFWKVNKKAKHIIALTFEYPKITKLENAKILLVG